VERFWNKINKNGPLCQRLGTKCWLWVGATSGGYGVFRFGDKTQLAHRVAWVLSYGSLPEWTGDMKTTVIVRHDCDTPLCCNPEHLRTGHQSDNGRDKQLRARARGAFGVRNGNGKLSDDQIAELFSLRKQGYTQKEVATRLGVSQPHVSDIEKRKKRQNYGTVTNT